MPQPACLYIAFSNQGYRPATRLASGLLLDGVRDHAFQDSLSFVMEEER